LFVVIAISQKLQSEGDDLKKKRSLALLLEEEKEEKWHSVFEPLAFVGTGNQRFQLQSRQLSVAEWAAFEGQMFAHNGFFGQGGRGAMENAEAEVPVMNEGRGRNNENGELEGEFIEIPDFAYFGDEADEREGAIMMDIGDVEEEFGVGMRVRDERDFRRVPSFDDAEEFMIEEEEHGRGHAHGQAAGILGGWANDVIINPGEIEDLRRRVNDPIPQELEPPHGHGIAELPRWMEEVKKRGREMNQLRLLLMLRRRKDEDMYSSSFIFKSNGL